MSFFVSVESIYSCFSSRYHIHRNTYTTYFDWHYSIFYYFSSLVYKDFVPRRRWVIVVNAPCGSCYPKRRQGSPLCDPLALMPPLCRHAQFNPVWTWVSLYSPCLRSGWWNSLIFFFAGVRWVGNLTVCTPNWVSQPRRWGEYELTYV